MPVKFREVELPFNHDDKTGRLFLHHMPGRYGEKLEDCIAEMQRQKISTIFMLSPIEEVERESPAYYKAIKNGIFTAAGIEHWECPIRVNGIPRPEEVDLPDTFFARAVAGVVFQLGCRSNILIHCGKGRGRTGMFAACVLIKFDVPIDSAIKLIENAGSEAGETPEQRAFVKDFPSSEWKKY